MQVLAIIQARMGSKRLPGKVMLPLGGKPVLEHVIERVARARKVNEVVVATTLEREDLRIVEMGVRLGVRVYCGSVDDVLDRFYQVAKVLRPEHVVRITADCPLIDPEIIDMTIETHLTSGADFTATSESFPDGLDVEVFDYQTLKRIWIEAKKKDEKEHVTLYIRRRDYFKKVFIECEENLGDYRWTLDRPEDYTLLKKIFDYFYPSNGSFFSWKDVLEFVRANPEISMINSHIKRNEAIS
jgi:spore coat polysaccharide biosynthesis protein SpsF (cytidylyltransferase family)